MSFSDSWKGWHENMVYPGTHWMFYDNRGNYRTRVDLCRWENGKYRWRVMRWNFGEDTTGLEESLEAAQIAADKVMNGIPFQFKLGI